MFLVIVKIRGGKSTVSLQNLCDYQCVLFTDLFFCKYNNNNHFLAHCAGLPRWAGTRRKIHPL